MQFDILKKMVLKNVYNYLQRGYLGDMLRRSLGKLFGTCWVSCLKRMREDWRELESLNILFVLGLLPLQLVLKP